MAAPAYQVYEPLGTLKPVGEDIWIVDGPEIRLDLAFLRLPFPTRMTVVRLPGGGLWLHSPVAPDDTLAAQLQAVGTIAHLIAPNTLHYRWINESHARFPGALVWGVDRFDARSRDRLPPHGQVQNAAPHAWGDVIDQVIIDGTRITEAAFFHRPSATLVLTDLIENFEASRFNSRIYKWLSHAAGIVDPDGKTPADLRRSFLKNRSALRAAVDRMIAWNPQRIVMAHGRWYTRDAVTELKRAFRWIRREEMQHS